MKITQYSTGSHLFVLLGLMSGVLSHLLMPAAIVVAAASAELNLIVLNCLSCCRDVTIYYR